MVFKKIFFYIFLFLCVNTLLFSQDIPDGTALSDSVYKTLSKKSLSPDQQQFYQTGQDKFAYNVLINLEANLEAGDLREEKTSLERDEVIFCFTQEDFYKYPDEILNFISFLKKLKRNWTATLLFSALDNQIFKTPGSISGTEIFSSNLDYPDSCLALIMNFDSNKSTSIYTAGKRHTSPLFLTKFLVDAFYDTKINFSFEDSLSAIYRLGIVKGRERLSHFFDNDVPAIEINLSDIQELSVIKKFSESYRTEESEEWDMHYIYIGRSHFLKAIFINEKSIILICLSVGIFTILILCVFSFTGKHGQRHKYEFIKSSYMIPFTLAISFLSLYLGQYFVAGFIKIFPINPIFQYGIKILFSMIFVSVLFAVQEFCRVSITSFIYGYLLLVVAIMNIFLFATRDLTLFVIFAIEYIIIYISRSAKNLPSLILFFILMMLPFIPYGYIIIKNSNDMDLSRNVFCTPIGNILLSFAIFPFQITWIRMLFLLNVRAGQKGYTFKKIIVNESISTAFVLTFIFATIFSISHFIYKPSERAEQNLKNKIIENDLSSFSLKIKSDEFSGMNTNHIMLSSKENALKYEVFLTGEKDQHLIYDSIYNYKIISDKNGIEVYAFTIPDCPPKNISIDYAASLDSHSKVEAVAFYKTDKPHIYRIEKRELIVE